MILCYFPQRSRLDGSSELIPITNVTAIINEVHYKDSARLIRVVQSHSTKKSGPFYFVKGTCDQIDDLSVQLSAASKCEAGPDLGQQKEGSSLDLNCVSVSAAVMNYIRQKCSEELNRIAGSRFFIEIQPEERPVAREGSGMLLVSFRPRDPSVESRLCATSVRQRFIVFYQKTASDMTVMYLPTGSRKIWDLQRRFPQLLFESSGDGPELTITGTFAHVAMCKTFLQQKLPRCPDQARSSTSSANRREHQEESCPICLESIDVAKKTTLACKHSFCTECLKRAFDHKPVCPACGKVYGVLRGTQPEGGRMAVSRSHSSLPGYEQYGTIIIHYSIPSGIQQVGPRKQNWEKPA